MTNKEVAKAKTLEIIGGNKDRSFGAKECLAVAKAIVENETGAELSDECMELLGKYVNTSACLQWLVKLELLNPRKKGERVAKELDEFMSS